MIAGGSYESPSGGFARDSANRDFQEAFAPAGSARAVFDVSPCGVLPRWRGAW